MAQIAKGQAVMTLRSAGIRLVAGAGLALGLLLGGALLSPSPAQAQGYLPPADVQASPWYMPPAWVRPPQTGPRVRKLAGYYGHNRTYSAGSYGSYSNGCYGYCPRLPGMITSSYGVVLQRPTVAIFDPSAYQVVPVIQGQYYQSIYQASPPAPGNTAKPVQPLVVPVSIDARPGREPQSKVSIRNGVRIIRPAPVTTY
jgi:hypothetical protein